MSTPMISRELHADLDTPVSAYLKLRQGSRWSFLFESVEGREVWATYSIIGVGARRIFRAEDGRLTVEGAQQATIDEKDPLTAVRAALARAPLSRPADAPRLVGGIFGFLAYDAVRAFERLPGAPYAERVPDALFVEPELLAVFDNRRHALTLHAYERQTLDTAAARLAGPLPPHPPARGWQEPQAIDDRAGFERAVDQAKEHIRAGDIIQVVLSRRFELPRLYEPVDVYRGLRTINPSPYLFFYSSPDLELAGASPEVMIRVRHGEVVVRPIAGTRPRASGPDAAADDARLAAELLADPKERAEHIMLVDLGRNDVGRVSAPGTVSVHDLMTLEQYSHVMHIVSEVRGKLDRGRDCFDALRAAFPAGTLSGAPKVRAMEIIDTLERRRRGIYGGAVGYFGPHGDCDFGIAIRTLVAHPDKLVLQAGAGIVADSVPAREADETEHKARAVLRAARWAASRTDQW